MLLIKKIQTATRLLWPRRTIVKITTNHFRFLARQISKTLRKVALITGGGSGIGFAIARAMVENGYNVILVSRDLEKLQKAKNCLGANVAIYVYDLQDVTHMADMFNQCILLFGRIDILINNASKGGTNGTNTLNEQELSSILNTNARGAFFLSQQYIRYAMHMKTRGRIINISSMCGIRPLTNAYHISKCETIKLTGILHNVGIADLIDVRSIAPGSTSTNLIGKQDGELAFRQDIPIKYIATPEEVANLAMFIVSGMADNICNPLLLCDGGYTKK